MSLMISTKSFVKNQAEPGTGRTEEPQALLSKKKNIHQSN